ncbi:hypothetical protein GOP47_0023257 [Adiantum capillus-veneris]|uniref:Uncharacterized protein n=1 Tax=Adiantum capillus-veneris TaxID=13818 RepID=A0A9D4U817_ADICA|nr:hypothetical protein GOP47_0023257 [Adiantum capillus-veneris]
MGASSTDHYISGREKAACLYWVGGFVFMGFAAGTMYQHHASFFQLAAAYARAAAEHAWDAVCVALAIAAIAMGLLGGHYPDHDISSRHSPAFHEFMSLGLAARQRYCYVEDDDGDDDDCCCTVSDSNIVALIEASADNSVKIDQEAACNHNQLHQAGLHVDQAAPGTIASSHEALSLKKTTSSGTLEVRKSQSQSSETARMPDEYAGDGEDKLGYGVLQELEQRPAAGPANYSMQALQGGWYSGSDAINASNYDRAEEEEWTAEINRKADAFIASFREQMRRELQRELMLCT